MSDLSSLLSTLIPGEGGEEAAFGFLTVRSELRPADVRVHALSERAPGLPLVGSFRTGQGRGAAGHSVSRTHFATGAFSLPEAEKEARLRGEREAVEAFALHARGDVADLFPGAVITLEATAFGGALSGDWIVERLSHRAAQSSGQGVAGDDLPYLCEARLIRSSTPYRPAIPPRPPLPLVFPARIESDGPCARLDDEGRYRLRPLFDAGSAPRAEASIPIRRLTPHASPPGELPSGWHTPLHDGAEVLLSCLNGDPDQPMIAGVLPNPCAQSPVTSANPSQNILRTASDNELLLDDQKDARRIRLRTFEGRNLLELDACAAGQKIALASKQGSLQLRAGQTMHLKSGDTLTEQIGADRIQSVKGDHRTETKQGEIHHQAATDITQKAGKNVRLQGGKNIEFTSGKRLRIDADRNARVTVKQGDASFTTHNGQIHIQSAKAIDIRGQGGGDIAFAQKGGGFTVKPDGGIVLFGEIVSLKADRLTLDGPVDYQTGGGAPPAMPEAAAPLEAGEIPELQPEGDSRIIDPAWSRTPVPVGEEVEACFSVRNFRGGETAEVTVFETNEDGGRREVDRLRFILDDGAGHYRLPWRRSAEEAREDLVNDENAGDMQPLTYIFQVAVEEAQSPASSGLNLTSSLSFAPVDQQGNPFEDGTELQLTDSGGSRHVAAVREGEVLFEEVLLGPWQLHAKADNLIAAKEN